MNDERPKEQAAQRGDFAFDLPEELIAQAPPSVRGASRLLALDGASGARRDLTFADLPDLLRAGDLLVRNQTRVLPARLHGTKDSGGQVEVLLERVLGESRALVQLRASKPTPPGRVLHLPGGAEARVAVVHAGFVELDFDRPVVPYLEAQGEMPLPPYIRRAEAAADRERYQTVYARRPGAVAAPTAGLHFDEQMFARLAAAGVECADVTLHIGAGTFQPLRQDSLEDVRLHEEWLEVDAAVAEAVARTRARGGRVIAIGTTVVRSLETAALQGALGPYTGQTSLFIRPGFRFRVVDALITNFHLPESSLVVLVSAFAGREAVLEAYRHAVRERYRFFSYGDAMFITPATGVRS
jgi:S-adenosylmethionine:tRNA ribosyltransferase-isomerase